MPAFLTHWRILIETARRSQDAGKDLGSLIIDASTLRRRTQGFVTPPHTPPAGAVWDTGPLPEIDFRFPGSDISSMAYLGALAPDIPYYRKGYFKKKITETHQSIQQELPQPLTDTNRQWGELLHSNRSGDFLLTLLEQIASIPSPASRSQALAFAMGYLSHIATDIALNPYISTLSGILFTGEQQRRIIPFSPHFYIELCLDQHTANTYFDRPLYGWTNQPWEQYIEPAAQSCTIPSTPSGKVLDVLKQAAENTYSLTEKQSQLFYEDYLAGLQRLRGYLAGRGIFRLFTLNVVARSRKKTPLLASIAEDTGRLGETAIETVIQYAINLSEHLCRRAMNYYSVLRNPEATAQERSQKRMLLCQDLRNWDMGNGYTLNVSFDEEITIQFLHNWIHFAHLWDNKQQQLTQSHTP